MDIFQAAQYADSTKKSISTAQKSYEGFCARTGCWPDPDTGISSVDFNRYIVLMARTKKYKTVLNYITMGVRTWHLDQGIPYVPSHARTDVTATLKGLRRIKGDAQNQKLPLTLRLLEEIRTTMDSKKATHLALWAAYLICFFCLLRKGQVTATSKDGALKDTHLLQRTDVLLGHDGRLWIRLVHTKTIQFRERVLYLPVPSVPGSSCCPTDALRRYLRRLESSNNPLLFQEVDVFGKWVPLTYSRLLFFLKQSLTTLGYNPAQYAGQSFRRGGATYLLSLGMDIPTIKAMGDWKSDAYLRYLEFTMQARQKARARVEQDFLHRRTGL